MSGPTWAAPGFDATNYSPSIDLPPEVDPRELWVRHPGRFVTVERGTQLTSVGGVIPIEPPIDMPTGGYVISGGKPSGIVGSYAYYTELAAYAEDGHRTHYYRLDGDKFAPVPGSD